MLHGTPSNLYQSGWPPIFDDAKKACLRAFITHDATTHQLS